MLRACGKRAILAVHIASVLPRRRAGEREGEQAQFEFTNFFVLLIILLHIVVWDGIQAPSQKVHPKYLRISLHNAWLLASIGVANLIAVGGLWVLQAYTIFVNDPLACGAKPCISLMVEYVEPVDFVLSSPGEATVKQRRP